ncbi:hypothetical protein KFE69_07230 [bacterium SCSIO 12844]|nr:hypothetical protein KFE69_07230 [bacterium SCSIO 12844]
MPSLSDSELNRPLPQHDNLESSIVSTDSVFIFQRPNDFTAGNHNDDFELH